MAKTQDTRRKIMGETEETRQVLYTGECWMIDNGAPCQCGRDIPALKRGERHECKCGHHVEQL